MSKGNLRRHERIDTNSELQLMWLDRDGTEKYTSARTLDVSESGMRVLVPEPLPERSYVTFRADKLKLHGRASVRSCTLKGTRFVVGLEFAAGMRFKSTVLRPEEPKPASEPVVDELNWDAFIQ